MNLPSPREKLADCMWLPRIWTKAKLISAGELSDEFAPFFCHPKGVDGQFLGFFSIDAEEMKGTASLSEEEVVEWFRGLPQVDSDRISEWNQLAENLGRPGFPMHDRLGMVLKGYYSHVAYLNPETVFEVLEADDRHIAESAEKS